MSMMLVRIVREQQQQPARNADQPARGKSRPKQDLGGPGF